VDQFLLHADGGVEDEHFFVGVFLLDFLLDGDDVFVFEDFEEFQEDSLDFLGDVVFEFEVFWIGESVGGVEVVEIQRDASEVETILFFFFENFDRFQEVGNVSQNGPNGRGRVLQVGREGEEEFLDVEILNGVFHENDFQVSLD